MAAAYAALVSLTHILHQIQNPPPGHQITLVGEQIEYIREKATFLIDFLENYSNKPSKEMEDLETQIAYAAYAAEDVIESNVVDQILARSAVDREKSSSICEGVQRVVEEFLSIERELAKIKDQKRVEDLRPQNSTTEATSSRSLSIGKKTTVGFEEHLIDIMSALTTDELSRLIIPIVGMGGIGKTTLATNVYNSPFILKHFDIRVWITISQEYTTEEILQGIWLQLISISKRNDQEEKRDDKIGELVYKELFGRKYLIVMDDMWDIQAWEEVKRYLPDDGNGSRILVTTRLLNLAVDFGSCSPHKMDFLDEKQSWDLLREKVFAKEVCPIELEEVGKTIAKRCRGLPLALVVIGGLLAKSKRKREHWEYVKDRVTFTVNYENDEHCLRILLLSYSNLPIYLRPCFLYLAVFPEDFEIQVTMLIRLWVAEGFMRPIRGKSSEEVAEEYLEDLIDRNLILVGKKGSSGKVKTFSIHDLVRDLCSREAHKGKFLYIPKPHNLNNVSPYVEKERRLIIHSGHWKNKAFDQASRSSPLIRSFLSYSNQDANSLRLLRVFHMVHGHVKEDDILSLINLRYISCTMGSNPKLISSSMFQLWNLQTLVVDTYMALPAEIWNMPQLRHIKMKGISLCDPPPDSQNTLVLENLQTLSTVQDFKCSEQVIKRIPNLKKLGICYRTKEIGSSCVSNLVGLCKLESLVLAFITGICGNIAFPSSLKKLSLWCCLIPWEDMSIVGSLPNLEVLKLPYKAAKGQKWSPVEGEFCRLKFLFIDKCELEIWEAENSHFPSLEHLILGEVSLNEIPVGFAEIPNLQVIELRKYGNSSLWTSAEEILKQRESLAYEGFQIRIFGASMKIVLQLKLADNKIKQKAIKKVCYISGVDSIAFDSKDQNMTVTGDIDPVDVVVKLRKICYAELESVGPAKKFIYYDYQPSKGDQPSKCVTV